MFDLPIVSRQARDLVEAQFAPAEDRRGPATKRRVRAARKRPRSV
jgi:hypothetical protein